MSTRLLIDDNFENGAVDNVHFLKNGVVAFDAPLRGSPFGMWFYFGVRGGKGKKITFRLSNISQILGGRGMEVARPVIRSSNNVSWERLSGDACRFDTDSLCLYFTVSLVSDTTYVAYCYPYTYSDLRNFLKQIEIHPDVKVKTIGKTGEGRPLPCLSITNLSVKHRKKLIGITARQHAGEVPSSFVLEGMVDALLADNNFARQIRHNYVFKIIPMVDIDGVVAGRYGKNAPPVDFNRDWCADPLRPEIRYIQNAIEESTKKDDYCLFIDLHAPTPEGVSYLVPEKAMLSYPKMWKQIWDFGSILEKIAPQNCPLRVRDYPPGSINWADINSEMVAYASQFLQYGVLALGAETAYHRAANGRYLTPTDWRMYGKAWILAIKEFFEKEAGNKNSVITVPFPVPYLHHWDFVHLPQDIALTERNGTLSVKGKGNSSFLWIANRMKQTVNNRENQLSFWYRLESQRPQQVTIHLFFYISSGARIRKTICQTALLPPSNKWRKENIPFFVERSVYAFRPAFKIKGLEGKLDLDLSTK